MSGLVCFSCHQPVRPGVKFCSRCGRPIPPELISDVNRAEIGAAAQATCPRCGRVNRAGARFCSYCRADLPSSAAPSYPGAAPQRRQPHGMRWIFASILAIAVVAVCVAAGLVLHGAQGKTPSEPSPSALVQVPTPDYALPDQPVAEPLSGYQNASGHYALNYPTAWQGTETASDVVFVLPSGASVYVHVEPAVAGQSLDQYVADADDTSPQDVQETRTDTLGGAPAICQDVSSPGDTRLLAVVCFALNADRRYAVSLANLTALSDAQVSQDQNEFDLMCKSFLMQD